MCINSIMNNEPVEFDCDIKQYLNPFEELLDTKCYDYNLVFNTSFDKLSKKDMMNCLETYPNHAMIITGVDLDLKNNPIKWKVENSWGRDEESSGYYSMDNEWFKKFVFNIVINKKYANWRTNKRYEEEVKTPIILRENDIMS